ncbi:MULTISPECIES: DUF6012 family protein [Enterobacterales]|jgi:hypothetical protein|uniref:DUF6012 family protein n=7 Tax=Enterobacterales TaxID=91347 RepID=A0AAW9C2I3_KLUCR|nr:MULTISPECIES: DUF6012 family protein [Enterobacterales]EFE7907276.1 hypothetical protein [Escherichia coli]EFM2411534.1 hypothetical protein [Escherichia coli]EJU24052.1 hypothetical protein HMPREF1144_0302 [Klebsiella sp. OBRC7]EKX4099362.1 hypothetical protein [Klebsiella pneumoniae]ELQ8989673.1 hypothetical protein [Klebsiella oxytoca]
MYLHLVPTLYHIISNKCQLESVTIPELEFEIKGDALSCGRPYPNKRLNVGMLKNRKAMVGLLLEYDKQISQFTTEYKWAIENIGVVQHNIKTIVLDSEFDLISQCIGLNIGLDEWKPRLHPSYQKVAPVKIQPMMESYRTGEAVNKLQHDVWANNALLFRTETLLLHTLESERLSKYSFFIDRLPQLDSKICI